MSLFFLLTLYNSTEKIWTPYMGIEKKFYFIVITVVIFYFTFSTLQWLPSKIVIRYNQQFRIYLWVDLIFHSDIYTSLDYNSALTCKWIISSVAHSGFYSIFLFVQASSALTFLTLNRKKTNMKWIKISIWFWFENATSNWDVWQAKQRECKRWRFLPLLGCC